jgi:hypothetical protein
MLAADKLLLQSNLKRNATELKEKEFRLHHDNFSAVGTQVAKHPSVNPNSKVCTIEPLTVLWAGISAIKPELR